MDFCMLETRYVKLVAYSMAPMFLHVYDGYEWPRRDTMIGICMFIASTRPLSLGIDRLHI